MIFLLKFLLKCASKSSFFRFGVEIRFWSCKIAAICGAVERSSIVFCNSVPADRNGMAAHPCCDLSRRRSHWSGCIKVPMVMRQLLFSILALVLFCCDTSVCKSFSVLKFLCAKASVCKSFRV